MPRCYTVRRDGFYDAIVITKNKVIRFSMHKIFRNQQKQKTEQTRRIR